MTIPEQLITIALCALATVLTRFLPFLIFSEQKPTPRFIQYLGRYLPAAVFGMLIVYCLKNVDFMGGTHGLLEFVGIAVTVGLHLWRRNMLLSIAGGTVCYMVLLHLIG